jgi:hypothetical protein
VPKPDIFHKPEPLCRALLPLGRCYHSCGSQDFVGAARAHVNVSCCVPRKVINDFRFFATDNHRLTANNLNSDVGAVTARVIALNTMSLFF